MDADGRIIPLVEDDQGEGVKDFYDELLDNRANVVNPPSPKPEEIEIAVIAAAEGVGLRFSISTQMITMSPAQAVSLGRLLIKRGRKEGKKGRKAGKKG